MRKILPLLVLLVIVAGCGGSSSSSGSGGDGLKVSAATSLKKAFTRYGGASFSFAGSDALAAQIREGAKPDVYAAANTKLPDALYAKGLVEKPQVFATNTLVLAVPAGTGTVRTLADAGKPGVKLAIGSPTVPVGSYTRKVLGHLPAAVQKAILGNVRSSEPDVGGVVGKLTQHAVDAGFVYITDVVASGGRLRAIRLPASTQPKGAYAIALVKGAPHAVAARKWVAGVRHGAGAAILRRDGFGPPP